MLSTMGNGSIQPWSTPRRLLFPNEQSLAHPGPGIKYSGGDGSEKRVKAGRERETKSGRQHGFNEVARDVVELNVASMGVLSHSNNVIFCRHWWLPAVSVKEWNHHKFWLLYIREYFWILFSFEHKVRRSLYRWIYSPNLDAEFHGFPGLVENKT